MGKNPYHESDASRTRFFITLSIVAILILSIASVLQGAVRSSPEDIERAPGTTSQLAPDQEVLVQSFYIGTPGSCYGSNINCFVNANGSRIQNLTVTAELDAPFNVTSSLDNGNFSLQINAYSPDGYLPSYMQWVIGCGAQFTPGQMGCYLQTYYVQANDGVLLDQGGIPQFVVVPSADLTTGTNISISADTNSTGDVVSASGQIVLANGTVVFSSLVSLTTFQYGSPIPLVGDARTPIVGFEAQLIGDGNGDTATFTEASGSLVVKAAGPIWSSPSPVGLPYVQYNLPNKGTVEKSNIAYGAYVHPTREVTNSSTSGHSSQTIQTSTSESTSESTRESTSASSTSTTGPTTTTSSQENSGGGIGHYLIANPIVWLPFLIVAVTGVLIEGFTVWSRKRRRTESMGSRR